MKKKCLFFIISFIFSICSCAMALFPTKSFDISANEIVSESSDLESFLKFEQEIIDLNSQFEKTSSTGKQKISSFMEDENNVEPNSDSEFYLKRLIVQGEVQNTYGAIKDISYNNLHILCYLTEMETKQAYEELKKSEDLNVIIDEEVTINDYAENDYDYSSLTNWSPKAIDIKGYREYLDDEYVNEEVVVVVLDTGINTSHTMFTNRLLQARNGKVKGFSYYDSKYQYSYNNLQFDSDDPSTALDEGDSNKFSFEDDHSHGTHVAGIICDLTPENVKILPIKIANEMGHSTTEIMITAYLRVINIYSKQYKVVCTNLSFTGGGKDGESDRDIFNNQCYEPLLDKNILPITAAGNDSSENNIEGLKAVVVSSLKKDANSYKFDNSYSNYGKIIDISAPGTKIYSAVIAQTDQASSSKDYNSGTSMASPQVAGVAALLSLKPDLPADFTALDLEQMIYDLSLDEGAPGKDIYYGHGMLNIKYFEHQQVSATLSFYKDGQLVEDYNECENFEQDFTLAIECSKPGYKILYTTNTAIPTLANSQTYSQVFNVTESFYIYAMGVKVENGKIIERTNLYNIAYFDVNTPLEQCFQIDSQGRLFDYTGNFECLNIPTKINGIMVKTIGYSLFEYSNLKSIICPETLVEIAGFAFAHCNDLKFVYAPNVTKIYLAAFTGCPSITAVSDQHPKGDETSGVYLPNVTEMLGFTFSQCENLESVSLSKLESLGDSEGYDFQACYKLESAYLPLIKSIPKGTFALSENLSGNFYIGEFVSTIGQRAFAGCKIDQFTLNQNNKYLFTDGLAVYSSDSLVAFACGNENDDYEILDSVNINKQSYKITKIEQSVMSETKINNLTIPENITTIEKFAFSDSIINKLNYNAKNCVNALYYEEEDNILWRPFDQINTIEIGSQVEVVPERLFSGATFKNVIINSYNTKYSSACFYIQTIGLNKIIFNFEETITDNYVKDFAESCIYYKGVNYVYTKTEAPYNLVDYYFSLPYHSYDGEFHIYSKEQVINQYKILSYCSTGNGIISPNGEIYFNEGESVTYTFIPNDGYRVEEIKIDGVALTGDDLLYAMEHGYTFKNIIRNHTISVSFKESKYIITTIQTENGTISPSGQVALNYGNSQKYTFTPNAGYHLASIIVDGVSLSQAEVDFIALNGYTFSNVKTDHTISAVFELNSYIITATADENGTITPDGNIRVKHGESKKFSFSPNEGYEVSKVVVDGVDIGKCENYAFNNVTDNHTINVIFDKKSYTISSSKTGNGTISPLGQQIVKYGEEIQYTFTPSIGYKIKDVVVNGNSVGAVNSYIFANVTSNQTIHVEFEIIMLTITVVCGENGTISPSGTISVEYGSSKTFSIIPSQYCGIAYVEINGKNIEINNTIEINNITENIILKVGFNPGFLISSSSGDNGSITQSTMVAMGSNKRFDFYPNEGYQVKDVIVDGVSVGARNYYVFTNITSEHTIHVEFEVKTFKINLSIDGQGSISSDKPLNNIPYGEDVVFVLILEKGWSLSSIYVNGELIELKTNKLIINNIDEDINIDVTFEEEEKLTFNISEKTIAIIAGAVAGAVLIVGLTIKIRKKSKKNKMQDSMNAVWSSEKRYNKKTSVLKTNKEKQDFNGKEKRMSIDNKNGNQLYHKAHEFVKGREQHFLAFCAKYGFDYRNNYENAVIKYYQAYLRSLKISKKE